MGTLKPFLFVFDFDFCVNIKKLTNLFVLLFFYFLFDSFFRFFKFRLLFYSNFRFIFRFSISSFFGCNFISSFDGAFFTEVIILLFFNLKPANLVITESLEICKN